MPRKVLRNHTDHPAVAQRLAELNDEGGAGARREPDRMPQLRVDQSELHGREIDGGGRGGRSKCTS
eukprot:15798162-Heterocapsa_arctica.AAC.1